MINPITGRPIKAGSRVHRQLVSNGLLEGEVREAGRPTGSYKVVDHTIKNKKNNVSFKIKESSQSKNELKSKLMALKKKMEKSKSGTKSKPKRVSRKVIESSTSSESSEESEDTISNMYQDESYDESAESNQS
jgi:hypothetical protein